VKRFSIIVAILLFLILTLSSGRVMARGKVSFQKEICAVIEKESLDFLFNGERQWDDNGWNHMLTDFNESDSSLCNIADSWYQISGDTLYFKMKYYAAWGTPPEDYIDVGIFLDVDRDSTTGYDGSLSYHTNDIGPEYLMAPLEVGNSLSFWNAGGWSPTGDTIYAYIPADSDSLIMGVALSDIGDTPSLDLIEISIDINTSYKDYLPDSGHITIDASGIENNKKEETSFKLCQNSPNPFVLETAITYEIPVKSMVSLKIVDVTGRSIRTLEQGEKEKGIYTAVWNGLDSKGNIVPVGIYLCVLKSKGASILNNIKMLRVY